MSSPRSHLTPPRGDALLENVVALGLTRLAVPPSLGGLGGSTQVLAEALRALARQDLAAALIAWAQRMAIEALCHAPNLALRGLYLPDFIDGSRAAAMPWLIGQTPLDARCPIQAREVARGWRLSGQLGDVANLQWEGYAVICPVWFAQGAGHTAWVMLRSEEDGLGHVLAGQGGVHQRAACGALALRQVSFREDELLADDAPALLAHLRALDAVLRPAVMAGMPPRDADC